MGVPPVMSAQHGQLKSEFKVLVAGLHSHTRHIHPAHSTVGWVTQGIVIYKKDEKREISWFFSFKKNCYASI